jgi:hypothetical protein
MNSSYIILGVHKTLSIMLAKIHILHTKMTMEHPTGKKIRNKLLLPDQFRLLKL